MTERLTLQDAAQRLGITPDALRQRIRRGQYRSDKTDGRVYVYIDTDRTQTEQTESVLVSKLRAHIEDLQKQLERASERDRENRRIIAALTQQHPGYRSAPGSPRTTLRADHGGDGRAPTLGAYPPRCSGARTAS